MADGLLIQIITSEDKDILQVNAQISSLQAELGALQTLWQKQLILTQIYQRLMRQYFLQNHGNFQIQESVFF